MSFPIDINQDYEADIKFCIKKKLPNDKIVALFGNPNVGKSTVFNALTGLHQHTGNWAGKTIDNAIGYFKTKKNGYVLVDLPGTYSLFTRSKEEEIARDFLCNASPDACIIVCDATALERNLILILQTIEMFDKVLVCINLLDEAEKKGIKIDSSLLSNLLGVPVTKICARDKKTLSRLTDSLDAFCDKADCKGEPKISYPPAIQKRIVSLAEKIAPFCKNSINPIWLSAFFLDSDDFSDIDKNIFLNLTPAQSEDINQAVFSAKDSLSKEGITKSDFTNMCAGRLCDKAGEIYAKVCKTRKNSKGNLFDRRLDKILTSKVFGFPAMILMLGIIFWLTISGANLPSAMLSTFFSKLEVCLFNLFTAMNLPKVIVDATVFGVFRVLFWVVSVMLPPMAIFFPLFTFLEDIGYLPRIAYNLDRPFKACNACGKQALTMCMGFGCNACGVSGCRIIDSPRERLIAILTNNFVPCNGRFPAMISVITIFFAGASKMSSFYSALLLTLVIVFGVLMTFALSYLLSKTLLRGTPSFFTLELPPYRRPQIFKIITRSLLDRTIFVLGRAISVAAPAGLIIWLVANIHAGDASLLKICSDFLDPFGKLLGLDGVIIFAFILGFPANEIVLPIAIMAYCANGTVTELSGLEMIKNTLVLNDWNWITACSFLLFSLLHFPCSTTMLTIKKETKSIKWTLLAFFLPTAVAIVVCMVFASTAGIFVH